MTLLDIAVGIDGSDGSVDGLQWAAGLAQETSASVRTVTTWTMPLIASMPSILGPLPSQAFMASHSAERIDNALAAAGLDHVERTVREGDSGEALAAETEIADLVVVGRTGLGRRHGLSRLAEVILGSTARYCLHHAKGPVAAVPSGAEWVSEPTVVVGVDSSPSSHAALAWAVENLPASAKIIAIRAVPPYVEGLLALDEQVFELVLENARTELAQSIEAALGTPPNPENPQVEPLVLVEPPRYALIEPGFKVDLVVVGERGRSPIVSRVLGSISDHAVRHAACPVIVVPATTDH